MIARATKHAGNRSCWVKERKHASVRARTHADAYGRAYVCRQACTCLCKQGCSPTSGRHLAC
eukprot:12759404-Alexandrium_andersonii.AAC.1